MKRCASAFSATLVLLSLTSPATGRNYSLHSPMLWSPQETESLDKKNTTEKEKTAPAKKQKHLVRTDQIQVKDGVSFREVTVAPGDTLSSITGRYYKEGASYSEILRVNKITNPGRIKAGDVVKVVLNRKLQNRLKTVKQVTPAAPSPPTAPPAAPVPNQVKNDQIQVKDGVSFREVTVVPGDTLTSIAVRYHKEGASYSEILSVNKITNPGRIKAGDVIKVVLNRKLQNRLRIAKQGATAAQATAVPSPPAATNVAVGTLPKQLRFINNSTVRMTPAGIAGATPTAPVPDQAATPAANYCLEGKQPVASASDSADSGQKMYEQAIRSYRQGDFKTAIRLFGELLAEHPDNLLAADVSLFIADCYLKLSNP